MQATLIGSPQQANPSVEIQLEQLTHQLASNSSLSASPNWRRYTLPDRWMWPGSVGYKINCRCVYLPIQGA